MVATASVSARLRPWMLGIIQNFYFPLEFGFIQQAWGNDLDCVVIFCEVALVCEGIPTRAHDLILSPRVCLTASLGKWFRLGCYFCDVALVCEGSPTRAHDLILSSRVCFTASLEGKVLDWIVIFVI